MSALPEPSESENRVTTGIIYGFAAHPQLRRRYLAHLRKFGDRLSAANYIGMTTAQINRWRRDHPDFAVEEDQAQQSLKDAIEDEIKRRAIEGITETRIGPGGTPFTIRKYSDTLLLALAKRHIPEYRESRTVAVTGDVNINHEHKVDVNLLSPAQRDALRVLLGQDTEHLEVPRISLEPLRVQVQVGDSDQLPEPAPSPEQEPEAEPKEDSEGDAE